MQFATKLVSTRRGTLIAALAIALLAGASILLYLNSYRDSLKAQGAMVTVLVAKQSIPKGTAGSVVASKDLYTVTTIRESQLLEGAMSDPATLRTRSRPRDLRGGAADGDRLRRGRRLARGPADRPRADRLRAARLGARADRRDRAGQPRRRLRRLQRDPARRRRQADQRRPGAADAAADHGERPVVAVGDKGAARRRRTSAWRRRRQGGEARVRLRQRQGVAGPAAERRREGVTPGIVTVETMLLGVPPVQILKSSGSRP